MRNWTSSQRAPSCCGRSSSSSNHPDKRKSGSDISDIDCDDSGSGDIGNGSGIVGGSGADSGDGSGRFGSGDVGGSSSGSGDINGGGGGINDLGGIGGDSGSRKVKVTLGENNTIRENRCDRKISKKDGHCEGF